MKRVNRKSDMSLSKNNRQLVYEFHKAFEMLISEEPYHNIFVEKPEIVLLRYNLIKEEYEELLTATRENNLVEVIDALMDILYVLYGAAISFGVNTVLNDLSSYTQSIQDFNYNKQHKTVKTTILSKWTNDFGEILNKYQSSTTLDAIEKHINELIVCTYFMCFCQGIDADYCFNLVHQSNMSKLCASEDIAKETVSWYKENSKIYDSPEYKYNARLNLWIVYNKSSGKVLKSIKYFPVNFTEYLSQS